MTGLLLASALLASTILVPPPQDPSGARPRGGGALLGPAADRDGDGAVTAEEWRAFVAACAVRPDGTLDPGDVKARLLLPGLDRDGDRKVTRADLEAALRAFDRDGDERITADERRGGRGGGALTGSMLVELADADADGEVTRAERDAFVSGAADAELTPATVSSWIARLEANVPADRNAFTPGVYLLTLDASLDSDSDGRLTRADLDAVFARLDADGDGALSAQELAPRGPARDARTGPRGEGAAWGGPITEADRAKPGLIPWQRDLADALALQARTQKPLLIAVNMDGETASEGFAWKRYRDPRFAAWASGFVCLIASPDRHAPRDHDDRGRRLEDPRFGRVVCDEHIAIEPELFDRYFGGRRVAPRHVGVAPDGTILFDLFLLDDLGVVDRALQEHGKPDVVTPDPHGMSEAELLDSPDAGHRAYLEQRFVDGDEATRARLARATLDARRQTQHQEILAMALVDDSAAVRAAAIDALATAGTAHAIDLFRPALRAAVDDPGATARLIDALERLALGDDLGVLRARAALWRDLAVGLSLRSTLIDVGLWRSALRFAGDPEPAPTADERDALDVALDQLQRERREHPGPAVDLELARLTLRYALATRAGGQDPTLLLEDARRTAERAIASMPQSGLAHACGSQAAHLLDDGDAAMRHAIDALPRLLPHAGTRAAAETLAVFAQRRVQETYAAMGDNRSFPSTWVSDVNAAYAVLLDHPAATEAWAGAYLDWLDVVGGWGIEAAAGRRAIARFPGAAALHERWRGQLLRDGGAAALEAAYDEPMPAGADGATWDWFRGLAKLVAAERHTQDREPDAALGAWARAVEAYDRSVAANAEFADSATHYQALALAGMSRAFAARDDLDAALKLARAALDRRPASADSADGLGETPRATARAVADRLERAGRADDAAALRALAAR